MDKEKLDSFPFEQYAEAALGVLGWSPQQFWQATPNEVRLGLNGWRRSKGLATSSQSLTKKELFSLLENHPD